MLIQSPLLQSKHLDTSYGPFNPFIYLIAADYLVAERTDCSRLSHFEIYTIDIKVICFLYDLSVPLLPHQLKIQLRVVLTTNFSKF